MGFQRPSLAFLISVVLVACGSGSKPKDDNQLIGAPPTEKDDPFFFVAMPSAAEAAESTGTIGEANSATAPPLGDDVHCFSCIRICGDEQNCSADADVICGWGTHPVPEVAMTRATAECDGALNLARYTPTWAGIDGECPVATCKPARP